MMRTLVLVFALITFVSSEPVRTIPATKGPKTYVSPEDAPNQFIMEDSSDVSSLAQVKDEPVTPYYTGPAQHEKKGTPGAAFLSESETKDSIVPAQMVPTDVLNDPQALWDLKGAEAKHGEQDVNGMMPAEPIPGFDSGNPVMVQGPLSSAQTPSSNTNTNSQSTEGVVEADVVALEKQANIEEEHLREIKAEIVQKKQAHVVEKEMKFKEKLLMVQKQKDDAIEQINQQAAEQERLVLEQEAEEASKVAQEQMLSTAEKNEAEKKREASPLPIVSQSKTISLLEQSSKIKEKESAGFKILRMREAIQKKKDEDTKTDAEEESREVRAASHLRNSISSSLAEAATEAEARAHHESSIAHIELERAKSQPDQNGWSFLRTATHHIEDAASYLKQKEESLSLQDFVDHSQERDNGESDNVATTVTLVDPTTVIDDSSFIQVNRNVMKATGVKPARELMAKIKQMKKASM